MSQETNLNVSPYFDDFDASKNYYKILFKPSFPVQARELTGLQSILQNQIEQFGNHVFKEGSIVIPGQINYNNELLSVEIESEFLGISLENYIEELLNKTIIGSETGISAKIVHILDEREERSTYTLYLNYLSSGLNGQSVFNNSETLLLNETITSNSITIQANQGFANTISRNSTSTGSCVVISDGVYFLRGSFVNVYEQLLILEPRSTTPSFRVGLEIFEEIITFNDDESLADNAQGFNNYAAPGADRLKISAILSKKDITEDSNENFVELLEVRSGEIRNIKQNPQYDILGQEIARRTYDTSGDYYVKPFLIQSRETLNDLKGNNGVFLENQLTYNNNVPLENLGTYKISPGKAFVKGYEVDIKGTTYLDFEKPREVKTLENQSINYFTGSTLTLNRVYGSPNLSSSSPFIVSLRDSRVGINSSEISGKEIGLARVYDFKLQSGSYNTIFPNLNEWEISLFDIQPYTEFILNEPVENLSIPTRITGRSSGASAFLRYNSSQSGIITAYEVKGNFSVGEQLIFDSLDETRVATAVTNYSVSDIKSINAVVGSGSTFNSDVKLSTSINVGSVAISVESGGGISTVTSSNFFFINSVKIGDVISYSNPGLEVPTFAVVKNVFRNSIEISSVSSVSGVCSGELPQTNELVVSDFKILSSSFIKSENNSLYTLLPKNFISSVDLTNSNITIRKEYAVEINNNSTEIILAGEDLTFLPFDEGRYVLTRSDGKNEVLTVDKFKFTSGSSELRIDGLSDGNDSNVRLIATLRKINVKSKVKNKNKVNIFVVDKSSNKSSGIGSTTINDGLLYGNYPYGTRTQDEEICLLKSDITKLYGIFESDDVNEPKLPSLNLFALSGPSARTEDLFFGEEIVGTESNAIGLLCEKINDTKIGFVYLNTNTFSNNEVIKFKDSGITATINLIEFGSNNITNNYRFEYGSEDSIYNYSKIIRNTRSKSPSRKLKIIFESASYSSSDIGDITTVNSYSQFNYCNIPSVNQFNKNSDIIDIRPKVSDYNVLENIRSPFEFLGRNFDVISNSSRNILASDESINLTYSFYLPRIDRIYLNENAEFLLVKGISSENPELPSPLDNALEIGNVFLSPYVCDIKKDLDIKILEHKRYRMKDIYYLEDRIKKLELFTTLSLLETKTENLKVLDSNGLDRFKSGFVVDNFTTTEVQSRDFAIKNSIDTKNRELRPSHYTTEIDLILGSESLIGIGTEKNPTADSRFVQDLIGNGVKRTGQLLTLDYNDLVEVRQPFATRVENVTPYLVKIYNGSIELSPSSDIWIDTVRVEPNRIEIDNFTATQQQLEFEGFDPQTGFGPIQWDSWETTWTGRTSRTAQIDRRTTQTTTTTTREQERSGERLILTELFEEFSQGDSVVSIDIIPSMRSRNIEFISRRLKPFTQVYAFFDGIDVNNFIVPKLIEISMISGIFTVGETVIGRLGKNEIRFRVAKQNHRVGPIDDPTDIFTANPYDRNVNISSNYSSTSSILNVDTFSLSGQFIGDFFGNITNNMILRGLTSGSQARITNVRLITDNVGTIIGSFYIPNPNDSSNPNFEAGTATFRLTNNINNSQVPGINDTLAEEDYFAQGQLNTVQERIISVRSPRFETEVLTENRTLVNSVVRTRRRDPLAQSFNISESTGVFVTKLDLFFQSKDDLLPVTVQIRTMSLGTPTTEILPFSEVDIFPNDVKISENSSVATTVTFPSPIYLNGQDEFAIILLSDSTEYKVWISRFGEVDVRTLSGPESEQIVVTEQPNLGSLFKSQNGSTWTPSQYEDLKFTLYKANFVANDGVANFFNPDLSIGNKQVANLLNDSIELYSKNIRIGLGSTIEENQIEFGNTIIQNSNNASGNYVGAGGSAFGNLTIVNSGIGYTPSLGSLTYQNVPLIPITGSGKNASANITIQNGVAIAATIFNGGSGYSTGDIVSIQNIGLDALGRNIRLSISEIKGINELILDNVQGDFEISPTNKLEYFDSNNNIQQLNSNGINQTYISDIELINDFSDGLHIKVNHKNHGMHSKVNNVVIGGVSSDLPPVSITSDYSFNSSGNIELTSTQNFELFENQPVGQSNPGYIRINDEIISYTGVVENSLTGITRGIDQTGVFSYFSGDVVQKYELSGISLRRINTLHGLQESDVLNSIDLDSYFLKINMSSSNKGTIQQNGPNGQVNRTVGTTYPKLYISETKSAGRNNIYATQNINYEIVRPIVQYLTLPGTNINSSVRTISGTSISGNEISYKDSGFTEINLDSNNYFNSPQIVASKQNELALLNNLPGNKSFTLSLNLQTSNSNVSPVIDLDRVGAIFVTNRINSPITNYAEDSRVNSISKDPNSFIYVTKNIQLETPSTSLKVITSAYLNIFSDVRIFYSISNNESAEKIYYPFPGYNNLDSNGNIIDLSQNSGLPNSRSPKTDVLGFTSDRLQYRDYEFTAENLPSFKIFSIKIIGTSTNQAYPPRLRDFRLIALA
jgi:hypothetical protein